MIDLDKIKKILPTYTFETLTMLGKNKDVPRLKKWLSDSQSDYKYLFQSAESREESKYTIEYIKYLLQLKENKMLTQKEKFLVKEYAKKLVNKKTPSKKPLKEAGEDSTVDDMQARFHMIRWNAVGEAIKKKFRIKANLDFELDSRNRVILKCDNLISQCGIFKYAISKCVVSFFGANLKATPSKNGQIFWADIDLTYPGNGMTIGTVVVFEDGKIEIEVNEPRGSSLGNNGGKLI